MAIVIDGSGTITGIGTDGFTSGSIGATSIAANAATGVKMGYSGAVVQTVVLNSGTRTTHANSSMSEVSSNYRVSITPLFSNSLMLVSYHIPTGWGNDWAANYLMRISAKRWIGGGSASDLTSVGVTNGSRTLISGYHQRPGNGYDTNDMQVWAFTTIDVPNTSSTIQYGFYASQEGGTVYYGYSRDNNGSWGWDANIVIQVQEIKQ